MSPAMKHKVILLILAITFSNCSNVSESDLIDATPINDPITYTSQVKAIIDNNCIECHNNPPINDAPMSLLNYEDVVDAIQNRDLIDRISSQDLGFVMPFGGPRLPQNLIDIIIQWEEEGFIE